MQLALARYCKVHGLTKTQALERGIELLLRHEGARARHASFESFEQLQRRLRAGPDEREHETVESLKRRLDEKYPA